MTPQPPRLPRTGRLHKGYHRKQVDVFLGNTELALAGALPLPAPADIRQAGFELVRGGYDTAAVDVVLDALEERVLVAQDALAGRRGRVDPHAEVEHLVSELSGPPTRRFPHAGALRRGYDVADVDTFLDQVTTALAGGGGADGTGPGLSVEEVRAAPFRPRRGGYREDAVDAVLDRVVELLLLLRAQQPVQRPAQSTPAEPT